MHEIPFISSDHLMWHFNGLAQHELHSLTDRTELVTRSSGMRNKRKISLGHYNVH